MGQINLKISKLEAIYPQREHNEFFFLTLYVFDYRKCCLKLMVKQNHCYNTNASEINYNNWVGGEKNISAI